MSFEKQIELLAQSIYDRVINIIKENKGDDDKYYKYAYLKLKDKTQLTYDFSTETLYVTTKDTPYANLNFIVRINNMDALYYMPDECLPRSYETQLEEKYNKEGYKHIYNARKVEQDKLTQEEKEEIKKSYEELLEKLDDITYDENKTRCIENFTDELEGIYRNYMYEKELYHAARSEDKILPSVKVAVEWWVNIISGKERAKRYPEDPVERMMVELSEPSYPDVKIEKEKLEVFKEALTEKLMEEIYIEGGEIVEIGRGDYYPDIILYNAMIESGIELSRIPYRTELWVDAYQVFVPDVWGEEKEIIFDNTKKEDVEEVKRIYSQLIASRKSLKREK